MVFFGFSGFLATLEMVTLSLRHQEVPENQQKTQKTILFLTMFWEIPYQKNNKNNCVFSIIFYLTYAPLIAELRSPHWLEDTKSLLKTRKTRKTIVFSVFSNITD